MLNKYTLEETVNFITEKFADLGKTYTESSLEEKKALLGSIFPSGVVWYYPGMSNRDIGPLYQAIRDFTNGVIHVGEPTEPHLEHLFSSLLELYQKLKALGFTYYKGIVSIINIEENLSE